MPQGQNFYFCSFSRSKFFPPPYFPESHSRGHPVIRKAGGANTLPSDAGQKCLYMAQPLGLIGTLQTQTVVLQVSVPSRSIWILALDKHIGMTRGGHQRSDQKVWGVTNQDPTKTAELVTVQSSFQLGGGAGRPSWCLCFSFVMGSEI